MKEKQNILFFILGAFFIGNALLAEFIGVKIFSLEGTFGFTPVNLNILGNELSFNLTAGTLLWPVVFIMTDIVNEYFGKKGVRFISFAAAAIILYAFLMVTVSIALKPASFYTNNEAFKAVFFQSNWIIAGSLTAFLLGQLIDVIIFQSIKAKTGRSKIWLRATGSTVVSQLIDSFVVLFIAFYISGQFTFNQVLAIGIVNYIYKFSVALLLTPILYIVHFAVDSYLGKDVAHKLILEAAHK